MYLNVIVRISVRSLTEHKDGSRLCYSQHFITSFIYLMYEYVFRRRLGERFLVGYGSALEQVKGGESFSLFMFYSQFD
mgnify:CR=1 FL=1